VKLTPIDAPLSTGHADTNQLIGTVPTVATRPFRTQTTSTIWSADAYIIRMAIIAMITVRCRWFRIEEIDQT
jgi:hypothetical protein